MRTILATAILILSTGTAMANCPSMWLTRNMVFDRAGYCFGSTLGQSVFSNAGCIGTNVALSQADQDFVAYTRETEAEFQCNIDTGATRLDLPSLAFWLRLEDLPRHDRFGGSGCIGWIGPDLVLRAGTSKSSPAIGRVQWGDTLLFTHWPENEYDFVEITRNGRDADVGWLPAEFVGPLTCESLAG